MKIRGLSFVFLEGSRVIDVDVDMDMDTRNGIGFPLSFFLLLVVTLRDFLFPPPSQSHLTSVSSRFFAPT